MSKSKWSAWDRESLLGLRCIHSKWNQHVRICSFVVANNSGDSPPSVRAAVKGEVKAQMCSCGLWAWSVQGLATHSFIRLWFTHVAFIRENTECPLGKYLTVQLKENVLRDTMNDYNWTHRSVCGWSEMQGCNLIFYTEKNSWSSSSNFWSASIIVWGSYRLL